MISDSPDENDMLKAPIAIAHGYMIARDGKMTCVEIKCKPKGKWDCK